MTTSGGPFTKLFKNDGNGNFNIVLNTPFQGVYRSEAQFSDIDNDNDFDVLVSGKVGSTTKIVKLYTNDGSGNFNEVFGTTFTTVTDSDIEFADIDNDNDPDLLITGFYNTSLYKNNGSGIFTKMTNTGIPHAYNSEIEFADIDNDSDLDLLITGRSGSNRIAKLFTNDGTGAFTEVASTPFAQVQNGSISFGDIDNDNDIDVLITGDSSTIGIISPVAELYTNDGLGNFTVVAGSGLQGIHQGATAFRDIDNDNDLDLVIAGDTSSNPSGLPFSQLYINNGSGVFSLSTDTIQAMLLNDLEFEDIDNDLVMIGKISSSTNKANTYVNDGMGNFTLDAHSPFPGISSGALAFTDVDSDNDMDIYITGSDTASQRIAKLYENTGGGNYNLVTGTPFTGLGAADVSFGDMDNDNDQDLIISGQHIYMGRITELYENNGSGSYSLVTNHPFPSVAFGAVEFVDVDNDGDNDVFINGYNGSQTIARIYSNDGSGTFSSYNAGSISGTSQGSSVFADIDNDNDLDLFISDNISGVYVSRLYKNNGSGFFSLVPGTPFDGVWQSYAHSSAFADVDNDNDMDLLITGQNNSNQLIAKLYLNDGTGIFTLSPTVLQPMRLGAVKFVDIDNDNDNDLIMTGEMSLSAERRTKLYLNDGIGGFTEFLDSGLDGLRYSQVATADVDGNGYQDILISGINHTEKVTKLYKNFTCYLSTHTDKHTVCDSLSWIDGNTYYNDNDSATFNIIGGAADGCDSVITLDLKIIDSNTGLDSYTACDSFTWLDGNIYTSSNNSATHTLSDGCPVTLDLTIINSVSTIDI